MNGSPSVKVALFIRNGGSESPCRWFYVTGIYKMGAFPKEEELKKLLPWSEDLPEYCRTKLKK